MGMGKSKTLNEVGELLIQKNSIGEYFNNFICSISSNSKEINNTYNNINQNRVSKLITL